MELIRKSDALHAVLHNTGDAAVAAVQGLYGIDLVFCAECEEYDPDGRCCEKYENIAMKSIDYCSYGKRKEQTDGR